MYVNKLCDISFLCHFVYCMLYNDICTEHILNDGDQLSHICILLMNI